MKRRSVQHRILFGLALAITLLASACSSGTVSSDPVEIGRSLFRTQGCNACHATDSRKIVGLGLGGISDRGDEAYIRESIRDSDAVIVEGFPNVMPSFSGLSDENIDHLLAYLNTLD